MGRDVGFGVVHSGTKQACDEFGSNAGTQLERMARELKCAICLSLFAQAASLSCNHTFCSACILQSLKRASCCPMCKLPTARREVRAAPHMDNLVDAYLHMETALGLNIFASQPTEVRGTQVAQCYKSRSEQGQGVLESGLRLQRTREETCNLVHAEKRQNKNTSEPLVGTFTGHPEGESPRKLQEEEGTRIELEEASVSYARPSPAAAYWAARPAFSDLKGSDDEVFQICGFKSEIPTGGDSLDNDILALTQRQCSPDVEGSPCKLSTNSVRASHCSGLQEEKLRKGKAAASEAAETRCIIKETQSRNEEDSDLGASTVSARQDIISGRKGRHCAFCQSAGDSEEAGPMMLYNDGLLPVHVHTNCAEWAPRVFFEGHTIRNLGAEVARGQRINCSSCGKKGAALGCCLARCRRSFHYPCARVLLCRWHPRKFMILCPEHVKSSFPKDKKKRTVLSTADCQATKGAMGLVKAGVQGGGGPAPAHSIACQTLPKGTEKWPRGSACKWVLCGSALNCTEKEQLVEFAALTGATLVSSWKSNVTTHVIAGTDEQGAARRTLKYLMATLEGTWIVRVQWMLACKVSGQVVNEEDFEVNRDIHGLHGGPNRGRALAAAKGPMLFKGLIFYFCGQFPASYKADLQALTLVGGGVVLYRKPLRFAHNLKEKDLHCATSQNLTIVIYNDASVGLLGRERNVQSRCREANALASGLGAVALGQSWLLDSAASCKLQGDVAGLLCPS